MTGSTGTAPSDIGTADVKPISNEIRYRVDVRYKDLRHQPRSSFEAVGVSVIGQHYVVFFPDGERLEIHRSNVDHIEMNPLTSCCGSSSDWNVHFEFKDDEYGDDVNGVESFRRYGNEYSVRFND